MKNIKLINLQINKDNYGSLVHIETFKDINFDLKRIYYIYDVLKEKRRGFHSHRNLKQLLICVHGSVKILAKTPFEEKIISLNSPTTGLYIGPMIWREMYDFSSDAVLLVLASEHYDVTDYIRDYKIYKKEAKEYFKNERCFR